MVGQRKIVSYKTGTCQRSDRPAGKHTFLLLEKIIVKQNIMRKTVALLSLLCASLLPLSLQATDASATPDVASEAAPPSHEIWNTLLSMYVSDAGAVNYQGFQQSGKRLEVYLNQLSQNAPQSNWSQDEQLAYWINAYNAFTVQLIVENYPLSSITKLDKPWDMAFITIGGKPYSLNDIEHKIIRTQFAEPRIHFAVNCASQSCPPLLNEAYAADKLEQQLTRQTKAFLNNPKYNDLKGSSAALSKLFDWYKEDFTKSGSIVDFINQYATQPLSASASISFKEYDWNLNE
jgi:hypothetical protein